MIEAITHFVLWMYSLVCKHRQSTVFYEQWHTDPDVGEVRGVITSCNGCGSVLEMHSELKGATWE